MKKLTAAYHSKELRLVKDLFTGCLQGFKALGAFTPNPQNRLQHACLLLATRSFNSLRCAYVLLQQGYYIQSLTLVRSAMEDNLTALDCEKCEATLGAVLEGGSQLGKGKLTYTEMARRQGERFHKAWQHNYGVLSEYAAHARKKSLLTLIDPKTRTLRLGGYYDRDLFIGACDALLPGIIGTADVLAKALGASAVSWQKKTLPKIQAANAWRKSIKHKVKTGQDV